MASGVKKLQINVDVQAAFSSALKQADNFKKKLSSLSLPKTITKDLEKDLADYQKNLQKILNFKPTTNNLGEYRNLISQLNDSFKQLSVSINSLESNTEEAFSKNPKIENYKQQIESLKKDIQALDKATKSYYGVTSSDSKAKQDAARKEKQRQTAGLTGAAAESTAKKQEQMTAALKESAKAKEKLTKLETQLAEETQKTNTAQNQAKKEVKELTDATKGLSNPTKSATESLEDLTKQANELAARDASARMLDNIKRITAVGVAVNYARQQLQKMKETYLELDASLTQIAVVSGKTRDEMWGNIGAFNEMARRLGTTTVEVVEASKLYYQQGKSQSEVMELVEQTAILASISELEFADATEYLTAAINGFKLEADDAVNITDVWANLAAKAAVDTDELAIAISKVASIAKSAGADIETTSAFLTKMIETTREAPENLGTALKTIIARFQELKDSTEALEDGVDANKVEKALKQADVALRDSAGQFRDFDDVIMELSSKWDGLDRNTQRYIATIAAGARQQSRFIALVEDYDRNVELVNMAQNSAGASAAQFNTQLTGLQASMNRLQASWEALYLSLDEGSSIFSFLIDLVADFVQSLADIGLVGTSIFAGLGVILAQLVVHWLSYNQQIIAFEITKQGVIITTKTVADASLKSFKTAMSAMGPYTLALIAVSAVVAAVMAGVNALNKVLHKNEIAARESAEAMQQYQGELGKANQEIASLESLVEEYNKLKNSGEDVTEIQQQISDQFPELAQKLDSQRNGWANLNDVVKEYIDVQNEVAANAARGYLSESIKNQTAEINDEIDTLSKQVEYMENTILEGHLLRNTDRLTEAAKKEREETPFGSKLPDIYPILLDDGTYNWGTKEEHDAQLQDLKNKLSDTEKELADLPKNILSSQADSYADTMARGQGITSVAGKGIFRYLVEDIADQWDSTKNDYSEEAKRLVSEQGRILNQAYEDYINNPANKPEDKELLTSLFAGDLSVISQKDLEKFDKIFGNMDAWKSIRGKASEQRQEYINYLTDIFNISDSSVFDDLATKTLISYTSKLKAIMSDDSMSQRLKETFKTLYKSALSGDLFEEAEISSELKQQLTNAFASIDIDDDDAVLNLMTDLRQAGLETSDAYFALSSQFDALGVSLDNLVNIAGKEAYETMELLTKGITDGLSVDEFTQLQAALEGYGYALELDGKMAYYSADGIKINNEALDQAKDAILTGSKAEIEATKASLTAQLEKDKLVLQAIENEISARQLQGESQAEETEKGVQNLAVLGNSFELLNNIISVAGKTAAAFMSMFGAKVDTSMFTQMSGSIESIQSQLSNINWDDVSTGILKEAQGILKDRIDATTIAIGALDTASSDIDKNLNDMADAAKKAANASGKSADAAKAYADALKEQAEALKAAAEAEQKRIETEVEGIKKVLEARKKALEEQNEAIQKQIDKEKEAQEILLEAYLKYLEKRKDEYQQTLDDMEKAAEKARKAADESNENLTFQNQIAQDYYKDQIKLIDEKINALNKEAEAEDRLQKLQEARDAYERAKNTKNRLVLVRGAGWVFKRDQEEISSTYDALRDAEREVEIAKLNEEKELLQDQADAWAEKAENIGKTTEELEKYNKAYKEFANMTEEQRKEALNAFIDAVIRNNQLNQDATDKENAFEDQSDAEKEGTLAWNIAKVEELSEQTSELIDKIGKSAEELIKDNKINQVVDSLDSLLGEKGIEGLVSHLDTLTHGVNSYIDNFLKLSEQMTQNESAVEAIDKALEDWDELTENLGKSQSELNKELQLFNYYNQMTIEQLSKDSAVYNDIANQVSNLADQWERVNAAQAAYEAAQARADAISKANKNGEGYATGGVNTYTGLAAVHGTKSRPEVFLNNSQAGALFKFIDGLTRMPTLNKRNTPQNVVASTSKTEDNSTNYTNCKFEVVSNEDSIDSLLQDVKNRSPLRKF